MSRTVSSSPLQSFPQAPWLLRFGPYQFRVRLVPRSHIPDGRRLIDFDNNKSVLWVSENLSGRRLVEGFFQAMLRQIHYANGCQSGCMEEAFTHSLATGLVEFAQRNAQTWVWFNELLGTHIRPNAPFAAIASGASRRVYHVPRALVMGENVAHIRPLSHAVADRHRALGFYCPDSQDVLLYESLEGNNRVVVALHEITHWIHDLAGIGNGHTRPQYVRAQTQGWMRVIRHNPSAWCWLVASIRQGQLWLDEALLEGDDALVARPGSNAAVGARRAQLQVRAAT